MSNSRILLLATFGMEIVECGGALAKNIQAGGTSYAAVVIPGLLTHGNYALAEPYRRLGNFHFESLTP